MNSFVFWSQLPWPAYALHLPKNGLWKKLTAKWVPTPSLHNYERQEKNGSQDDVSADIGAGWLGPQAYRPRVSIPPTSQHHVVG